MIYGFYFICKLKKHQIITNILEKAETLPSKVSVFCEKKESEKSSRKKMPKILFSCTSLVSTFIELSTNNVISILKSKVYGTAIEYEQGRKKVPIIWWVQST